MLPALFAPVGTGWRRLLFGRLNVGGSEACTDNNLACADWAADGECEKNAGYMQQECRLSCKQCTPAAGAAPPAKRRRGCSDEEDFECDSKAKDGLCDTDKGEMLTRCPRACAVCGFMQTIEEAFGCGDMDPNCKTWADSGECKANPGFMSEKCTVSCDTCEQKRSACNRPPDTPPAVRPGDIGRTYQRIVREFPQYNPTLISEPSKPLPNGTLARRSGAVPPWVVTLENFVSDEEGEAFIRGCQSHFDRSLAGDQLSPVRTSQQCWCSDNECSRNPLTQRVADRISNLTRVPVRYMEPFQVLKYEKGQFYKQHHDQNSGLWTPQGARVYTFFMYLNTPPEGGGTRFNNLQHIVPAVKGSAVMWPSVMDEDPTRDEPNTFHEALPVTADGGLKYAANAWVHNFDYRTPAGKGCLLTHKNTH